MKISTKCNMYQVTQENTWSLLSEYLSGKKDSIILVVSSRPLSSEAQDALDKTCARLGYGAAAITFLSLTGNDSDTSLPPVTGSELFAVLEGLDPLFIILTDSKANEACAQAYHCSIPLDKRSRVFGRDLCSFASFETLLSDIDSKQKAWRLLKGLPKNES